MLIIHAKSKYLTFPYSVNVAVCGVKLCHCSALSRLPCCLLNIKIINCQSESNMILHIPLSEIGIDSSLTLCIGVRIHGILEYTLRNVIALLGNLMEILSCSFDFSSLHCYLLSLCDWTPINWTLLTFLITLVWITIHKLSSNQKQSWRDYIFDKITIPSCK